jgi:16S rRNA processing protein RimM
MSRDILLGVVIGAHGLGGEVKVKTFTAHPENFEAYGVLRDKTGRQFRIAGMRAPKADIVVARFDEIKNRDAADALKGTELFVAREALPPPDEDEFYHADLIGLAVEDESGNPLGVVGGLHNFGAGDVLAVARSDGDELFLPFTRENVPIIDMKAGRVVVAPPEEAADD